jgi:glycosyltransferase involved in cell wall biosynthesis
LLDVLNQLPDWTLVLAGPAEKQYVPAAVLQHSRVRFTGSIPYEETPTVINRFDVAIIPFLKDEASAGIYPLKMFEYLAAGKPVVSTNFNPEILIELLDVVATCDNANDFAYACRQVVETESAQQIEKRKRIAEKNTWAHRARQWQELIVNFLNAKQHVGTNVFKK